MPKEVPFEPSVVARVSQGIKYIVSGITPLSWFGPAQPLRPAAQELAVGRQFDYPVGVNLRITPRQGESASFAQLRALGDNYDLLRLLIETRKDQMVKIKWSIAPTDKDLSVKNDPRIIELNAFFRMPDKVNPWQAWLRALLEDMLVIDAATIYPRMTRGGGLYSLELMDGATIKRVIDDTGRSPLVPDPAYQQILKGVPAVDYTTDQLIYAPRNLRTNKLYGFSPCEQIIMTVNIALRRQIHLLQYYTEGSTPDLIFSVPATWNPDQIKSFEGKWNARLEGNTAARRRTQFVPEGAKPFNTKDAVLKDDFDEWLARVACYAFSVPPTPFIKQINRATAETAQEAALSEGLVPLMQWVKDLMNRIIWKYFGYEDLEFSWSDEVATDQATQSKIDDTNVKNGTKTINEVRASRGDMPVDGGDMPMAFTGAGYVPIISAPQPLAPESIAKPADEPNASEPAADKFTKAGVPQLKKSLSPINRNRRVVQNVRTKLTTLYTEFLGKQAGKIAQQVIEIIGKVAETPGQQLDRILAQINLQGWDTLVQPTENLIKLLAKDGGAQALAQLQIDDQDITNLSDQNAIDYAKDRAAEMVGKKFINGKLVDNPNAKWSIVDGTRTMLRTAITQATEEGWSNADLASAIENNTAFSPVRASMIARTESAKADVAGTMAGYRASGVVSKKSWLLAEDPCPICQANGDEGVIGINESFQSGDDAAPAHPNCECDVNPVVDKAEAKHKT